MHGTIRRLIKIVKEYQITIVVAACAVVLTAAAIYVTPLRHIAFISPAMNEMDPKVFYEDFKAHPDDYLFIDVRSANIYQSAHAKGAISVPIENLYDEHYSLPKTGKKIALICTTGRLAAIAYGYLENWGFRNLIHIDGGMVNWTAEGLPVEGRNIRGVSASDSHQ
jgi:rhodanese-related sulfurtransferase